MKVNVEEFKKLLTKITMNYYIDSVQINYDKKTDKIWSKMKAANSTASSRINIDNQVFSDLKSDITFNFGTPKIDVKPFIDLLDDEEVDLKINEQNVVLNKQIKIFFDDESIINVSKKDTIEKIDDYFVEFDINEDFMYKFKKIKKIGARFEKIYMVVENNVLYIETTDKSNFYSNGLKIKLCDVELDNIVMNFGYDNFTSLMNTIESEYADFSFSVAYLDDKGVGIIRAQNENEKYYLVSTI